MFVPDTEAVFPTVSVFEDVPPAIVKPVVCAVSVNPLCVKADNAPVNVITPSPVMVAYVALFAALRMINAWSEEFVPAFMLKPYDCPAVVLACMLTQR